MPDAPLAHGQRQLLARYLLPLIRQHGEVHQRGQQGLDAAGLLAAFLRYVAEQPALARMCMIEALSATPAATERYEQAVQRFVELTKRTVPHNDQLPDTIEETLIGGSESA